MIGVVGPSQEILAMEGVEALYDVGRCRGSDIISN